MKRGFKDQAGRVAELRRKIRRMRAEGASAAKIGAKLGTSSVAYHLKAMGLTDPAYQEKRQATARVVRSQVVQLREQGMSYRANDATLGITTTQFHLAVHRRDGSA